MEGGGLIQGFSVSIKFFNFRNQVFREVIRSQLRKSTILIYGQTEQKLMIGVSMQVLHFFLYKQFKFI